MLIPPYLSLFDPVGSGEGSIDPLSLQATYEQLAERIYPFMTARMSRPRFLTVMAVGARVCEDSRDEVAADGVTPPWLVFEWCIVEALVRGRQRFPAEQWWGIPGNDKVANCLRTGRQLTAPAYLKTPKVFGFSGVYKTLANGLEILAGDDLILDEGGYDLIRQWERDQNLKGFLDGESGAGAEFRKKLQKAVRKGLQYGRTQKGAVRAMQESVCTCLAPSGAGTRERQWLASRLMDASLRSNRNDHESTAMRRELLRHLMEWDEPIDTRERETRFLRSVLDDTQVTEGLRYRLKLIDTYEGISRLAEDAFRLIRHLSTKQGGGAVSSAEFSQHPLTKKILGKVGGAAASAAQAFDGHEGPERDSVLKLAARYQGVANGASLYDAVLDHHWESQRNKPPEGKLPWVYADSKGACVRVQYQVPDSPPDDDTYGRDYRSGTASRFLKDLGYGPA